MAGGKSPLKCEAIHQDIVTHQLVALSLMKWLIKAVEMSDCLRRLLCVLVSKKLHGRPESLLHQVILADTEFWKVVRKKSHHLFMNTLLMDMYGRNEFAIEFAKCYKTIMRDFIDDDHEHSLSVASLSVQIFTVPTLAESLMLNESILEVCLETFWNELKTYVGENGNLDFLNNSKADLRRADFILTDLRYLFRHKPKWSVSMRSQFLKAFNVFLDILKAMQGMDSVYRKTQTHIAYEPNWESGFNLQLWIIKLLELMLSWCCSDVEIFRASISKCIKVLRSLTPMNYHTVNGFVMVKPVAGRAYISIHATLSRFIAGLIPGITKFSLNLSEILELQFYEANSMEHQVEMMEYSLRVLVLLAQVNARMWKRNGYAILHQLFHYQNVRFASEMFDRDILLLQTMSAVMDSNHFLNVVLNKYNLTNWESPTYAATDEDAKTTECIAEEFFLLLLYILSERYVIGLSDTTMKEILKREVIHRLSLGPTSRSVLVKTLPSTDPDNSNDCTVESMLDEVLNEVATYREPGVSGKGLFKLKNEELSKCNQFFFHFSKTERSKMIEERKKIVKKESLSVDYLPLPPKFLPQFEGVLHMLCGDKMEHLLKVALKKANNGSVTSDELIEEVLLIIAVGLLEVKRHREENQTLRDFNFLQLVTKEDKEKSIQQLLKQLSQNTKTEYYTMLKWTRQLLQTELEHSNLVNMETKDSETDEMLLMLEKSRKAKMAQERRDKMMAQMKDMQKAFMKTHSAMFTDDANDEADKDIETASLMNPVAIGVKHSKVEALTSTAQCIFCHQKEEELDTEHSFVVTCFVHNSMFLTAKTMKPRTEILPELNHATRLSVSSCGHILHSHCWEKYYNLVKEKEGISFLQHRRRSCIDTSLSEYLCPLCNALCNTVLPLLPKAEEEECADSQDMMLSEFLTYLERFSAEMSSFPKIGPRRKKISSTSDSNSNFASTMRRLYHTYIGTDNPSSTGDFMELFAKKLFTSSNLDKSSHDETGPPLAWMACSFSLQSLECSHRDMKKNLFHNLSDRQSKFWLTFVQYLASNCHSGIHEVKDFGDVLFQFLCSDDNESHMSILIIDIFGLMLSLRFLMTAVQHMFQERSTNFMKLSSCLIDDGVLKICLVAYLVKIYITAPQFPMEESVEDSAEPPVVQTWRFIKKLCKSDEVSNINGDLLKEHVVTSLLPFLRCSTLFFHFLTGIKLPDDLKTGKTPNADELVLLLTYLNLPHDINKILSLDWLVSESRVVSMIERWCAHDDVIAEVKNPTRNICYAQSRRLITLPKAYSTVINMASGFKCPTVGDSSRAPSLCLICGTTLCGQCYCCVSESDRGACAMHSMECTNGVGIFLRVRQSEVLLMFNGSKGAFVSSPYLDQYGEPDRGFRRGNPLFLNEKRYEQLEQLWLQQKVPETIAQQMEMNRHLLMQDWEQQ